MQQGGKYGWHIIVTNGMSLRKSWRVRSSSGLQTCQPEMTKKTEIFFRLRFVIAPTVPRRLDNLVVNHIISY